MTVRIEKPAINVREELADLRKPSGVAGEAMLRAETPQEQFNLIGAGRRNLVGNGAMTVSQRGGSFTGWTNTSAYCLDRWKYTNYQSGTVTITQDSDAPTGFAKSLKVATTATDSGSATYSFLQHRFEGQDLSSLGYYTASPQPVTVSFWIKSNMVGTYTFNMLTQNSGRRIASTYTVNAADTWEYKTITFEGDASSYIIPDNNLGIVVEWWFAAGSAFSSSPLPTTWGGSPNASRSTGITVGINTSTSNYVNITGVQLELGKVATPFEHRSYGDELAKCQRYCTIWQGTSNYFSPSVHTTIDHGQSIHFLMRGAPSASILGTPVYEGCTSLGVQVDSNRVAKTKVYPNSSDVPFRVYGYSILFDAEL